MKITGRRADLLISIIIFICVFFICYLAANTLNFDAFKKGSNMWFQADTFRYFYTFLSRGADHYRTSVHPLFALITNLPTFLFLKIGFTPKSAVILTCSLYSGLWSAMLFMVLRAIHYAIIDSIILTALACSTASFIFFRLIPETFVMGSLTLLIAFYIHLVAQEKTIHRFYYLLANVVSISVTITNWMAGIITTVLNNSIKNTYEILKSSLLLAVILSAIQHFIYPSSRFFLFIRSEAQYMFMEESGTLLNKLTVFFFHTIITPHIENRENLYAPGYPLFSVQLSPVELGVTLTGLLSVLWIVLLINGFRHSFKYFNKKTLLFLLLIIGGQLLLHSIYGDETFLYSMHWMPFLVIVAGAPLIHTQKRLYYRALLIAFTLGLFVNNYMQFYSVRQIIG